MKNNDSYFAKYVTKILKRIFLFVIVAWFTSATHITNAQNLDPQKMATVMSIVNMYVLADREPPIPEPDGERVDIGLPQVVDGSFNATDSNAVYAAFELQEEGVEFCFDLETNVAISLGDIVVEVNGKPLDPVEGKDNCYQLRKGQQRDINYITIRVNVPGVIATLTRLELASTEQQQLLLNKLTRGEWNERAVRKVLKIFAFGGHARDSQIQTWADMDPSVAIQEMLNFDEHNLLLSPLAVGETYVESATDYGKLEDWANFISNPDSNLPVKNESFGLDGGNFDDGYNRMITVRGLNPFRQRIGFWETNYHLATNLDASVSRHQMAVYYDLIMEAHEARLPYHEIMGIAAKSAAVAEQYGHDRNRWRFDSNLGEFVCQCNDDFAREIHQLFYGIFGVDDPNHEDVTIPNTAKMLTDMPIENSDLPTDDLVVDFGTSNHHIDDLDILQQTISGADAEEKIDNLMLVSNVHPESLRNLPVMIIEVLADDNLSESDRNALREAWAELGTNRDFLTFIHAYAISDLFHGVSQFKYLTTHERALYIANKHNLDNVEAYNGGGNGAGRTVGSIVSEDNAGEFFRPIHNVFGGQTGRQAADSALVFENHYNRLTDDEDDIRQAVECDDCDNGGPWVKKWDTVLPQRDDGNYYVEDIAPWLWNHVVGSMENYTELERAHLYSLLGAARIEIGDNDDGDDALDFNMVLCVVADYQLEEGASDAPVIDIFTNDADGSTWDDYCRESDNGGSYQAHEVNALNAALTGDDIANDPQIQDILNQLGQVTLRFNETEGFNGGANVRRNARERVSSALNFIFTTPFVFAEGQ